MDIQSFVSMVNSGAISIKSVNFIYISSVKKANVLPKIESLPKPKNNVTFIDAPDGANVVIVFEYSMEGVLEVHMCVRVHVLFGRDVFSLCDKAQLMEEISSLAIAVASPYSDMRAVGSINEILMEIPIEKISMDDSEACPVLGLSAPEVVA